MVSAQLKEYMSYNKDAKENSDSLYLFNNDGGDFSLALTNRQNKVLHTNNLIFTPLKSENDNSLIMRFSYSDSQYVDFIYKLADDDYTMKFDISMVGMQPLLDREKADVFEINWAQKLRRQEKSVKNEQRYSHLYYKYVGGDVKELSADKNEQVEVKEPAKWIAFKNQFFAPPILIADEKIEVALLDSKVLQTTEDSEYLKAFDATLFVPAQVDMNAGTMRAGFSYYMGGPMSFSLLKGGYDKHIDDASKQLDLDSLFHWDGRCSAG